MASINGISLKGVNEFIGREGPSLQGNLYVGRTKVAFWSQDGDGGEDWLDMEPGFSEKLFTEKIVDSYDEVASIYPGLDKETYEFMPVGIFTFILYALSSREKQYKKYLKRGLPTCLIATDGDTSYWVGFKPGKISEMTLEEIEAMFPEQYKDLAAGLNPEQTMYLKYTSVDNFDIGTKISVASIKEKK